MMNPAESGPDAVHDDIRRTAQSPVETSGRTYNRTATRATALDEVLYRIGHDLGAPLRDIGLLAEWIDEDRDSALSTEARECIQLLRNRARLVRKTFTELLVYAGAETLLRTACRTDTAALLRDVLEELRLPNGFMVSLPTNAPTMIVCDKALRDVFRRLIDNCLRHHDQDRGVITINWRMVGDVVEWTVADDGPGIPEAQREKVFELFVTLNRAEENSGLGVGLAVARRLVELNGGSIGISQQGTHGTRVSFQWPTHNDQDSGT